MTLPDWKDENYHVNFEPFTYTGSLVDARIELKTLKIRRYLLDTVIPDAKRAILVGSELSGLLLVFSTVDYLTGFYCGKKTTKNDIVSYMKNYFPSQYKPFLNDIYEHIRCGLVHNLVLSNPWFDNSFSFELFKKSKNHLQIRDGFFIFSMTTFLEDTSRAAKMYLYDVVSNKDKNSSIRKKFDKRFNKKNAAAAYLEKTDDDES